MKMLQKFLVSVFIVLATTSVVAGVVITQQPLALNDVAGMNGHEMYGQLCASCHGLGGKGDGPAAPALDISVPDLTLLGSGDRHQLSHAELEGIIAGRSRTVHQNVVGMPLWELEFQYVRPKWNGQPRTAYARSQIHKLTEYVEELSLATTH